MVLGLFKTISKYYHSSFLFFISNIELKMEIVLGVCFILHDPSHIHVPIVNLKLAVGPTLPFLSVPRTKKSWKPPRDFDCVHVPFTPSPQDLNTELSFSEHSKLAYSVDVHVILGISRNLVGKPGVNIMFGEVLSRKQWKKVTNSLFKFRTSIILNEDTTLKHTKTKV